MNKKNRNLKIKMKKLIRKSCYSLNSNKKNKNFKVKRVWFNKIKIKSKFKSSSKKRSFWNLMKKQKITGWFMKEIYLKKICLRLNLVFIRSRSIFSHRILILSKRKNSFIWSLSTMETKIISLFKILFKIIFLSLTTWNYKKSSWSKK